MPLIDPEIIVKTTDILDHAFDQAELGVRVLRKAKRDELADRLERTFPVAHDKVLTEFGRAVAASKENDVFAFRKNFKAFVESMREYERLLGSIHREWRQD